MITYDSDSKERVTDRLQGPGDITSTLETTFLPTSLMSRYGGHPKVSTHSQHTFFSYSLQQHSIAL